MIKILCTGKIKETYINMLISDYLKRINKYHKIKIIETKNIKEMNDKINSNDYNIICDLEGKMVCSEQLATIIEKTFIHKSTITFIIGDSNGLSDEIKKKANYKLSFSSLTFPHQLFRGLLLEQIYRCFKIINNERYHK